MTATHATPPRTAARVRLVALHRSARRPVRDLERAVTVLGTGDGCDLILASSRIDAAHAAIVRLGGGAYLCDLGAPGGTLLNGRMIRWARLASGDVPSIGPFSFRVELDETNGDGAVRPPAFMLRNDRNIGTVTRSDPILVIGSDRGCDVVLADSSIAPRHGLIVWTDEGPILRDLRGRQSVRHNGRCVNAARLSPGDAIGVGPYEFIFDTVEQPSQTRAEPDGAAGRLPAAMPDFESLWPSSLVVPPVASAGPRRPRPTVPMDRSRRPPDNPAGAASPDSRGQSAAGGDGAFEPFDDRPTRNPATTAPSDEKDRQEESYMQSGARDSQRDETDVAAGDLSSRISKLEDRSAGLQARVAAAQRALDERARRLWTGLNKGGERILSYHSELQERARQALAGAPDAPLDAAESPPPRRTARSAPRDVEPASQSPPARADIEVLPPVTQVEAPPTPGLGAVDRLFAGTFEPASATALNVEETERIVSTGESQIAAFNREQATLEEQTAELAELVRMEREAMGRAEAQFEAIQFDIERLRASVERARERHRTRDAEVQNRCTGLYKEYEAVRREREELAARLRQLEIREAAIASRLEEAENGRRELEAEAEQLARVQQQHGGRLRDLQLKMEEERHRLRVRQTELQNRVAELAELARARRRAIEAQIAQQHAQLRAREEELRAQREAIEQAGRAQLEKTATELERVLSLRLAEIEKEVLSRQADLDARMEAIASAGPGARLAIPSRGSAEGLSKGIRSRGIQQALHEEIEDLQRSLQRLRDGAPADAATSVDPAEYPVAPITASGRLQTGIGVKLGGQAGALRGVDGPCAEAGSAAEQSLAESIGSD